MKEELTQSNIEKSTQLNTLAQKIEFNRNLFRKELETKNGTNFIFNIKFND